MLYRPLCVVGCPAVRAQRPLEEEALWKKGKKMFFVVREKNGKEN
jgi:hypothetical protein